MHGKGVLKYAFELVQKFLDENYWDFLQFKLNKRDSNLSEFKMKLKCYCIMPDPKYRLPLFADMKDLEER
jgi:hypothetical protein